MKIIYFIKMILSIKLAVARWHTLPQTDAGVCPSSVHTYVREASMQQRTSRARETLQFSPPHKLHVLWVRIVGLLKLVTLLHACTVAHSANRE
jgi:hypothetical protein